ncbi:MAG TPA: hypothetical protein VEX15_13275, partial [Nocardioidaceae bacterium]|nr:hypothetical protein [Nocardioidaceae bacterium]
MMYRAWSAGKSRGDEPSGQDLAAASGSALSSARKARSRFRNGWVPLVKGPGLEPKTVRNVHIMLHAALADAVRWRYVEINVA